MYDISVSVERLPGFVLQYLNARSDYNHKGVTLLYF